MHAHDVVLQEKSGVKFHSRSVEVHFGDPAADSVGIELVIPRRIERIAEISALAVAAEFHHLGSSVQSFLRIAGMCRPPCYASQADRTDLLGMKWVRDVVLNEFAGGPAGNVEIPVVEGKIDVRNKGRNSAKPLQKGREIRDVGG